MDTIQVQQNKTFWSADYCRHLTRETEDVSSIRQPVER